MWSYQKTIFRGIPLKYKDYPLTVSAMRRNEIMFLEYSFIETFGQELLEKYRSKISVSSPISFFSNVSAVCAWSWFLSLVHIIVKIQNDLSLLKPLQNPSVITVFENFIKIERNKLPEQVFQSTNTVFGENENYDYFMKRALSNTEVSSMVYGFEYFQHLNYDVRGDLNYNPFPTMVMDWTEDIAIANRFSYLNGEAGIVLSVDYDKYKQLLYDEWYPFIMHAGVASGLSGFTPYFDHHFLFSKNNKNMQNPKGVVLFWPWDYTVSELKKNELGRKLGFEQIHIF